MPSTYAHAVFGETMLRLYPDRIRELSEQAPDLFRIGLHGPDILFYYRPLTHDPVNRLGSSMHDLPAEGFFSRGAQVMRDTGDSARRQQELAYLLGFLCHFSLDSICHTYVEKKIQVSGVSHTEIETAFDRHLLLRDGRDPLRQKLTGHLHPTSGAAAVIAPFFEGVRAAQVDESLRSMVRCLDFLVAPQPWKRGLISLGLTVTGNRKAMGGLVMSRRPDPRCADSDMRLEKLMTVSAGLCLRLTENYLAWLEGRAPLDPWFQKTFSADESWPSVPVYPPEKEQTYEV